MGKKSVVDSEQLPNEDDSTMKAIEAALNPQQVEPVDLYREMLRTALQSHLDSQQVEPADLYREMLRIALQSHLDSQQVEPVDLYREMPRITLQSHLDSQQIRAEVPVRTESAFSVLFEAVSILV